MTVLLGDRIDPKYWSLKSAGTICDDSDWSESTEDVSLRSTLVCPHCKCKMMPLMQSSRKNLGTTFPWVGCDYQDVSLQFTSTHSKCGKKYRFSVRYSG